MPYREYAPPASLAGIVECFWTRDDELTTPHRVVPDGCIDIIFGGAGAFVVGAMTEHRMAQGSGFAAVRLRPGAGRIVLGHPAYLFTNATPALSDLWGGASASRLEQRLSGVAAVDERVTLLTLELSDRFAGLTREPLFMRLDTCGGSVDVDDLAFETGCSARQLRRIVPVLAGLGPKQLCRILRFRRAWEAVRSGAALARVAAETGFADQPHMTSDFREFAGCTPGEVVSVFSKTATPASA
jgi:AraC-like DNA-binding protein